MIVNVLLSICGLHEHTFSPSPTHLRMVQGFLESSQQQLTVSDRSWAVLQIAKNGGSLHA